MGVDSRKRHKEFFATAPRGLEELLVSDLSAAGVGAARATAGGAVFGGSLEDAYRACLWSRVTGRVLLLVADIPARDEAELHAGVMDVPWEEHFPAETTLAVDFIGTSDTLRHTLFGARRVKDGVVDRLRALRGSRPGVDLDAPGLRLVARLHRDRISLGIDISGPAHRRGYRTAAGAAPLRENLAAAVLLRAGWPALCAEGAALFDPLCGSGTFLIEAALMAAGAAPGERRDCGSPDWVGHDQLLLARLREQARQARMEGTPRLPMLIGADRDARVIEIAGGNAVRAGFGEQLRFSTADVMEEGRPGYLRERPRGLLVCNPPYGERLGAASEAAMAKLYSRLGELCREEFADWRVAILAPEAPLADQLGLRGARQYRIRNGPIDCRLLVREPAGEGRAARREQSRAERDADSSGRPLPPEAPEELSPGASMLANRLRKNLRRLHGWLVSRRPECYRIYDADLPEYAVAIDRYGEWLHVAEYAPPATIDPARAQERLREVMAAVTVALETPASRIVLKTRSRQRGREQYNRLGAQRQMLEVREGEARFMVNLHDYLDTGLFLDHRPLRRMMTEAAPGKRFLNLFAYTGAVSVCAGLGGARSTTSVDLSATYLDWAERNLALNGLTAPQHTCLRADCLQWLEEPRGEWDLVFLDPPSFSNSARMEATLDVQRDHVALIQGAMLQLAPGGELYFSTNRRGFRPDLAALADLEVRDLTEQSIDPDFRGGSPPHRLYLLSHGGR